MADNDWFVYLMRCADDTFYTGVTTDLSRRLRQHNGETVGGASYTRARRPVVLVWHEACHNRSDAQRREYEVRRTSKAKKLALAENHGKSG